MFALIIAGSVISVVGEMDENGYYTATYNNKKGIVPANFIQEIELLDADLISRLSYKVINDTPSLDFRYAV